MIDWDIEDREKEKKFSRKWKGRIKKKGINEWLKEND